MKRKNDMNTDNNVNVRDMDLSNLTADQLEVIRRLTYMAERKFGNDLYNARIRGTMADVRNLTAKHGAFETLLNRVTTELKELRK